MPLTLPLPRVFRCWRVCTLLAITANFAATLAAIEYRDHAGLTADLKDLASDHSSLMRVSRQALSAGKREVWLVELGTGNEEERMRRPGLLVVAGLEGNDITGSTVAADWVRQLVLAAGTNDATRSLLDRVTVYVFPRVNPDAVENYFGKPQVERMVNTTPFDDDHDGLVDEDGPEDLDGDGRVAWMRVESPEGEYIQDPSENRLLLKADRSKGEKGAWKLLSEGLDNDKDEEWNEDVPGGVNLNRNFPFRYTYFGTDAGPHPVSEVETRALADFVVHHPNIAAVFTFGSADNVVQTPKSEPGGKRPPNLISDADIGFYKELGRLYREDHGLKKELEGSSDPGTFSDWMYFHRGRLALAAKPWNLPLEIEAAKPAKSDSAKEKEGGGKESADSAKKGDEPAKGPGAETPTKDNKSAKAEGSPPDKRGEQERANLKWLLENAPEKFIDWKEFHHPDFPKQRVEVGGWAPFALSSAPTNRLQSLAQRHERFLMELAGRLPRIGVRKAETRHLGNGVFELVLQVENTGYLPTALDQGTRTREVLPTRVILPLDPKQILAGQKTTLLGAIAGSGGMEELRYIIRARGSFELEVVSALGGSVRHTVELKEAP